MSSPLLARDLVSYGTSSTIPSDKWILEATNWFAIGMNLIQRYVSEVATGPPGQLGKYTANAAANETGVQWHCQNFIMRDNAYTSFSVLAMSLILGFGGLVICSSLYLETIVGWIRKRSKSKRGLYRRMYWRLNSALQLQRMAFEEAGLGTWERCDEDIPVTSTDGEKMQVASEWDEWHPSIRGGQPVPSPEHHDEEKKSRIETAYSLSETPTIASPTESKLQASIVETEIGPEQIQRQDRTEHP
ncbi:uncharacterized protein PAC_15739 [Phialocephala subalpina]|uniref:Uncharacterized protein n=1 Tax=Phialocephala subalpina TaxID=576137 RepID=A0A1L7XLB9_9HELO|nr:uncharacterized protein PAC_15739 [Phialocephala subalpina]